MREGQLMDLKARENATDQSTRICAPEKGLATKPGQLDGQ
jgi:hypothetical protein